MANPDIGRCDCPVCGEDAAIRETGKGKAKAYVLCDWCGFQGFARGVKADGLLRGLVRGADRASMVVFDVEKPEIKQPAIRQDTAGAAPKQGQGEKTPVQVTRHSSDCETTIFDHFGSIFK